MSIRILHEIVCDNCGRSGSTENDAKEVRKSAERDDWERKKRRGKFVDLCPACASLGTLRAWDYQA